MKRLVIGIALLATACGAVPPLQNAQPAPELLAQQVLAAFAANDVDALRRLTLTDQEFRDHVWPELPAARPERNLPYSFVWGDLHQKSEQSLERLLGEHGGKRYELMSVRFDGETTQYETYLVHRDTVLTVRDEDGATRDLSLYGSSLEKDGGWKVFSYVVD